MSRFFGTLRKRVYEHQVVTIWEHERATSVESPAEIRRADQKNIGDVLLFQHRVYVQRFHEFLDRGDRGYLAYLDGKCVHRTWVKTAGFADFHHRFSVPIEEGEVFVHYCETAAWARGKHIFPAVLCRIVNDFPAARRIFSSVNRGNERSEAAFRKAGFEPRRELDLLILLGLRLRKTLSPLT